MDIVAHALWAGVGAKIAGDKAGVRLRIGWAAFWGIFPDLFTFSIPAALRLWWYATGVTPSLLPDPQSAKRLQFAWQLYHSSHSLLVFGVVFGLVWLICGRPLLEMLAWGLHILIDIFTHQGIFAVHFLWPFSSYGFNGIRWEGRWFMAANYGALCMVLLWIWLRRRHTASRNTSHLGPEA